MTEQTCTCPPDHDRFTRTYATDCPMARGGAGHVKACPVSGKPCPCYEGSTSHADCCVEAIAFAKQHGEDGNA